MDKIAFVLGFAVGVAGGAEPDDLHLESFQAGWRWGRHCVPHVSGREAHEALDRQLADADASYRFFCQAAEARSQAVGGRECPVCAGRGGFRFPQSTMECPCCRGSARTQAPALRAYQDVHGRIGEEWWR